jgi:hypothetical protein
MRGPRGKAGPIARLGPDQSGAQPSAFRQRELLHAAGEIVTGGRERHDADEGDEVIRAGCAAWAGAAAIIGERIATAPAHATRLRILIETLAATRHLPASR